MMDIKKNEDFLVNMVKRINDNGYYVSKQAVTLLIPKIVPSISQ